MSVKVDKTKSHVGLLCQFDFNEFRSLCHHVLILNTHNTTSPVLQEFVILVELLFEVFGENVQILIVFLLDFSQSEAGSSLLVNKLS